MRENTRSLDEMLGDFNPSENTNKSVLTGGTVTIWLSADDKARYDRLQDKSGRKFSKKAREVLLELISIAESRAGLVAGR